MSRRACVIGHPVAHSRSPLIHGYWLREHKIDGEYVREDVPPAGIGSFLDRLGETYVGANVTIPHKEAAFAKLKHPDPVARALGAANTLWFENGALSGTNTDVHGFLAHLDASLPGWDRRTETALVLGAGGAARSIVYALLERGVGRVVDREPHPGACGSLGRALRPQSHGRRFCQYFQGFGHGRSSGQYHVARHERSAAARARSGAAQADGGRL